MQSSEESIVVKRSHSDGSRVSYIKPPISRERTEGELSILKKEFSTDDHTISINELVEKYETDLARGLTRHHAAVLLMKNGPNCLIPPPSKPQWRILAGFLFHGFAGLLWIGAILSFIGYGIAFYDNPNPPKDQLYLATFGFCHESANLAIMDTFKNLIPKMATVIRDGRIIEIPTEELVLGDLVEIKGGDIVPADIRITLCRGVKVDNSPITGESEMQPRSTECTDRDPLETQNLVFYGTHVAEGVGTGIVIACGDDTLMGRIAGLTSSIEPLEMPIKKELRQFNTIISIVAIVTGITGMLVTMTACLTLTAKTMANNNCLVKNLEGIETLGSTNVICSDKTGTLTQNKMTVSHFFYDGFTIDVLGNSEAIQRTVAFKRLCRVAMLCNNAEFKPTQEKIPIHKRELIGDAMDVAILRAMETYIGHTKNYRFERPKIMEIPFNSTNKYQVSIHEILGEKINLIAMKGAPEKIIERCSTYIFEDATIMLTPDKRKELNQVLLNLGYMGERVLGFADFVLPPDTYPLGYPFNTESQNFPLTKLRFLGFISMVDPPRLGVLDAVEKCRSAGIRVIMITGDHPITAVSIAKKVGIISQYNETVYDVALRKDTSASLLTDDDRRQCTAAVITGTELREMPQVELENVLMTYAEIVFARTSPQQKLNIVEALQALGLIVAVTGDGINDSPALRKADIGISMGIMGSDVSKEAADMILLDDNFSSIVTGIEAGRIVFDNLKKSIAYVLTSNVPEIVPFIFFILLGLPRTLSIMSILLIDVGTDLWPAISLAYESAEADIMSRMPRDASIDKLITPKLIAFTYLQIGIIQTCAAYSAYFTTMALNGFFYDKLIGIREEWDSEAVNDLTDSYGESWTYKERMYLQRKGYASYFFAIVITQIADAVIVKTRRLSVFQHGMTNWVLNFGIIFEISLAVFVIYCPFVNYAFEFEPISWYSILPSFPFALLIIFYDEIRRYIIRHYPDGWIAREIDY
ncbi:hypothetical protein RI129_009922 [Pyrocoelia pectoralis]|uniref:Na(+)/K(+)-exchanging ATPase n=1 Tax=Pyrocoelia pectoralis TaxID=417401 RepID=A0AAN7ZCQ4_9COLE